MKQTNQPNIELIAEDEVFKTVLIYDETYPNYIHFLKLFINLMVFQDTPHLLL